MSSNSLERKYENRTEDFVLFYHIHLAKLEDIVLRSTVSPCRVRTKKRGRCSQCLCGYVMKLDSDSSTCDGLPLMYNLVPANMDEPLAAESVLHSVNECAILADKSFLGEDWQALIDHHLMCLAFRPVYLLAFMHVNAIHRK